ncbi:MAG: MCE family protein [Deltaproteobacteria bacterium]|nr:MCE family protein [Deltaproteobacteria bacterium]
MAVLNLNFTKSDVKVGLFVLLGLVLAGLVVFLIGDQRRVFTPTIELATEFSDVAGLGRGAPVRMGGVRIGQVAEVRYGDDPGDVKVHVMMEVARSDARRIRSDSVARIAGRGLLGDKMVVISRGQKGRPLAAGELVPSVEPQDLVDRLDRVSEKAEGAIGELGRAAGALGDEKLQQDLRESVRGLNALLRQVTEGEGYPHRFLTDKQEAERISRVVGNLDVSAAELTATLRELRGAVAQVRSGPGFAHDVLYGRGLEKPFGQVGDAAAELAAALRSVREADSLTHDLLFGGRRGEDAVANVTQASADLRDIVRSVKDGKGTLGALLVDPSVYEDLKLVLGNVQRNTILRALVRYAITQDEKPASAKVGGDGR